MTTDDEYFERGINLLHGFLTEYYVDDPEHIVKVPLIDALLNASGAIKVFLEIASPAPARRMP